MPRTKKNVSISIDTPFRDVLKTHAKKKHMSFSGWMNAAAEEKLARERKQAAEPKK